MNIAAARAATAVCAGCVSFVGMDFRAAPAAIAVIAAFFIRIPLIKPKGRWASEVSFSLLGMLGAFVTVADKGLGPGPSFWTGVGFGAIASSLAEIGRSAFTAGVQDRLKAAANALLGIKDGAG